MIKISNDTIDKTIRYLDKNYPIDDIYIRIAEGFEVIEDPETGECGFAAFHTEARIIFVASMMEPDELIRSIAHEYRHAMQLCNDEEFNEDDAEEFADKILRELKEGED